MTPSRGGSCSNLKLYIPQRRKRDGRAAGAPLVGHDENLSDRMTVPQGAYRAQRSPSRARRVLFGKIVRRRRSGCEKEGEKDATWECLCDSKNALFSMTFISPKSPSPSFGEHFKARRILFPVRVRVHVAISFLESRGVCIAQQKRSADFDGFLRPEIHPFLRKQKREPKLPFS